jgi:hypothetical protein
MKKRILLFTLVAGISFAIFTSESEGPGNFQYDCSGADANSGSGNPTGCSATGSACHGSVGASTPGITLVLELDSAGVVSSSTTSGTGHYKPGYTYTVKITGTNNTTTTNLSKWGFQVAATKGATAATAPVNAGTFQSTGLPAGVQYLAAPGTSSTFYANVMEHDVRLSPTSGTGGAGTIYSTSFTWTAPAAGTGTVSLFGALNAVNNNGGADAGDLWNTAHLVLNEQSSTSVANVLDNITVIAFPNPFVGNLQLHMENAAEGTYGVQVFGLNGKMVSNEQINVSSRVSTTPINTAAWAPGLYSVVLTKDNGSKVITVVKQ